MVNIQGRVKFNLLGRIKNSPRKPSREKIVSFLQLGLLAPNMPGKPITHHPRHTQRKKYLRIEQVKHHLFSRGSQLALSGSEKTRTSRPCRNEFDA